MPRIKGWSHKKNMGNFLADPDSGLQIGNHYLHFFTGAVADHDV
jgi:hypothetical protein